jgi:stage V sporulation protein SpoVS
MTQEVLKNEETKNEVGISEEEIILEKENSKVICLKVKADPEDITPEERKRNVKKLAGAISHSLRNSGEINVRAFGSAAIGKGVKALAIAKGYVAIQSVGNDQKLQLQCSPAFITTKIGENELTGICFCTFASPKQDEPDIDISKCKSVLMVKADPQDVSDEDRKRNVKKLAGAIAHSLEDNRQVVLRCFGNATISKASKAMAIARGYVAVKGGDMYMYPNFIVADMAGKERTGIAFLAYSNQI